MNPRIHLEATIGRDPEIRFLPSGQALCTFSVVTNDRKKNDTGGWDDVDTTWFNCSVFGQLAENTVESLKRGQRVLIFGKLSQRSYKSKEGEDKTSYQNVKVDAIGPSLQFATVTVNKAVRSSSTGETTGGNQDADPWATPAVGSTSDDPPF